MGACPGTQAVHVSPSWPNVAFAFSPESKLESTSLHRGGWVGLFLQPGPCGVCILSFLERVRENQGPTGERGISGVGWRSGEIPRGWLFIGDSRRFCRMVQLSGPHSHPGPGGSAWLIPPSVVLCTLPWTALLPLHAGDGQVAGSPNG